MHSDLDAEEPGWGEESDPTHVDARAVFDPLFPEPSSPPLIATPVFDRHFAETTQRAETEALAQAQLSSAALIGFGVIGGIYLLYTIGWGIAVFRNPIVLTDPFASLLYHLGEVLALAAAPLWFIGTLLLASKSRVRVRILWLLLGILVLVPWPFVLGA